MSILPISMFLSGIVLGFSIAAPVGPIGLLCIRRTLADGRRYGLMSGLGAASADAIYGAVAAFGLTFISSFLINQQEWLRLAGGLFLCFLGMRTFRSKGTQKTADARAGGLWMAYGSTFLLTLTNPMTILSFAAIFAGFDLMGKNNNHAAAAALVAGVFTGSSLWWLSLNLGVGFFRHRFSPGGMVWINRASGTAITVFGLIILFFQA